MTDRQTSRSAVRDFAGYRSAPPDVRWPNGAGLAVSLVVNIEEGAELGLGMGDERNEFIYEAVEAVSDERDLCMESHFEYGTRAGWPRVRNALSGRGMTATLNACGRAIELSPWIAEEASSLGFEVASHGWRWERHVGMLEDQEREVIERSARVVSTAAGTPTVGWHTRSATSVNTRRLLVEHGGFLYDSNDYNDDVPSIVRVGEVDHVVLPYAFDTNDMRFFNNGGFVQGSDFSRYCTAAFDRLVAESTQAPRMLTIGIHPRIIGRPGRIDGLEAFLDHIAERSDVWIARRDEIAHAWRAGIGLPRWTPAVTS